MVEQSFSKVKKPAILSIILAVVIILTAAGVFLMKNNSRPAESKNQVLLASVYNNKSEYDAIFSKLQKPAGSANADAGIISHHFLAKQLIAEFYNKVGNSKITTVFLVSPDHYNNYFNSESIAYTSFLNWDTPFGELKADGGKIKSLQWKNKIETNDSAMGNEHGVYTEIPFIKRFFPSAKIVPLVLKNNLPNEKFISLGKDIKKISGKNSILIVSSDFSHNISSQQAEVNDRKSMAILRDLAAGNINQVTNDCKQCLATLSGFLNKSRDSFTVINNENSFDISRSADGYSDEGSVTSYVSGYYSKKSEAQIMFAGDLMFDRSIGAISQEKGNDFIFDRVSQVFGANDLNVVNLEGPITDYESVSLGTAYGSTGSFIFTFDPRLAKTLFKQNIRLVDLGNNHIMNFGEAGAESTQSYLDGAGVDYFGLPATSAYPGGKRTRIENVAGMEIGFVSYNQFSGDANEQADALIEIKKLKRESDLVFVFCHWGDEYLLTANDGQRKLAHQFIDAGADLVVGAHPHVIESMETYKGKRIYYSLGDFVFDQYFQDSVRNGLGVVVKINKATKKMSFSEEHFYLDTNGQTEIKK